jgi:hypothetical protein
VLIFVIDRLDYNYIDAVRKDDPEFFDRLDGFTDFTNATALYCRTYPSSTFMLTGIKGFYDKPAKEYFEEAWSGSSFIELLREKQYTTNYKISYGYVYNDIRQLENKADNIVDTALHPPWILTTSNFARLSLYRYAPFCLKPSFWISVLKFENPKLLDIIVTGDDALFYRNLSEKGLSTQNNMNTFNYLHFEGCHDPFRIDENAQPTTDSNIVAQTKGCFHIVFRYLDELKKRGLYQDATIIITGDHGKSMDIDPMDFASTIGFFVKPKGSADKPLVQNNAPVSHDNFIPTILKSEGLEYQSYGISAFDVPEDSDVVRHFYYWVSNWNSGTHVLEHFEIKGNARDFGNWRKIRETPVLYWP